MKFYVLENKFSGEGPMITDFLPEDGSKTGEAPRCPVCGEFIGMIPLLSPIRVELETLGAGFADIAFGPSDKLLISDRFLNLYQAFELSGLVDIVPVEVIKVKSRRKIAELIPKYHYCRITWSKAVIDDVKSCVERDKPWTCAECRLNGIRRLQRVVLEPNSWSGEDIFTARGLPGTILTSEKFKGFCDQYKISNCILVPAEEYSFDHYPWEKSKGSVSQ